MKKLRKGESETSEEADVEKATTGEVVGEGISGAGFFHGREYSRSIYVALALF
ncbi:MAG: hypothetical protein ACJAQT_001310 [Akkermansiaceae bacterium]